MADLRARPALLRSAIEAYRRFYGVDLSEVATPEGGFPTFDAFFTRRLRPGARPLEGDERTLVSPADGRIEAAGPVEDDLRIRVKGRAYGLADLLGAPDAAETFRRGLYALVYLSPADYHRVHAPTTGAVHRVHHVGGTLFPVNGLGSMVAPDLLARNERVVVCQRSEALGEVATIMIGALLVGRISLAFDPELRTNVGRGPSTRRWEPGARPHLARGGELGVFHLGSTVLVVAERGRALRLVARVGDEARVGRALAVRDP
ncbi:MAG: archaetidylserine decarboxylase [Sandaracinaceae bacterium]